VDQSHGNQRHKGDSNSKKDRHIPHTFEVEQTPCSASTGILITV
jgi:hypothetical protein